MVRRLAGMALLMACMAAYWVHFEDRFAELEAETALRDSAGVLSKTEHKRLQALRTALREAFGLSVRLAVRKADDSPDIPNLPENSLYMAVTPDTGAARVVLPALVQRVLATALGPEPDALLAARLAGCVGKRGARSTGQCLEIVLVDTLAALGMPGSLPTTARGPLNTTLPTPEDAAPAPSALPAPSRTDSSATDSFATDSSFARATP